MEDEEYSKRLPFKHFLSTIRWVVKIYWEITPKILIFLLITTVLLEAENFVSQYVRAWVIDYVVNLASSADKRLHQILPVALAFLLLGIVGNIIRNFDNYFHRQIRWISGPRLRTLLYKQLKTLGIQSLESPHLNNLVDRSMRNIGEFPRQLEILTRLIGSAVAFMGSAIIIADFFPLFIPLLIIFSVPMVLVDQKFLSRLWAFDRKTTEPRRSANQSMRYLVESKFLHELEITHGHKLLYNKFRDFYDYYIAWYKKIHKQWIVQDNLVTLLRNLVQVFGFLYVIWMFWQGEISIGLVTFYIGVIETFSSSIFRLTLNYNDLYEASQRIDEFKSIFDLQPPFKDGSVKLLKMKKGPEIEFKDVDFSYPNSNKKVLKNLDLKIKSGEKVAIVGSNGAGKTTMVKLIARYYQTTGGKILVDGININDLKADGWHQNMGVLFQEYNTYRHLTAKENIFIGDLNKRSKGELVTQAAKRADAHKFIKEFENKYDQILSEKYKDGIRPSTGQWQRLAIARFFYRDVSLVIFDEPTASIDADSEKKIFNKIYKFFKNKTVIIISHRFSTVRSADRIIVLDKGSIVEQGSHEQLMKLNGKYAKSFKLQAEGYQ